MDPTLQPAGQNGLNVTPPRAEDEHVPLQIPGQARLDEVVGKAIGGTVIPTDIRPAELPTAEKLDAGKPEYANGGQPLSSTPPKQESTPRTSTSDEKYASKPSAANGSPENVADAKTGIVDDTKGHTPGDYPAVSRVGWLEAYKRIDGPINEFRDKSIWMDEFAGSALFGAVWHNAAALIVIPVVCYIVFKLGGGLVSLILIIAFGGKRAQCHRRERGKGTGVPCKMGHTIEANGTAVISQTHSLLLCIVILSNLLQEFHSSLPSQCQRRHHT